MQPIARRLVPVLIAVLATACGGGEGPAPAADPTVTVTPAQAELAPSGAQAFEASVTGVTGDAIVWTVEEGVVGGTVTAGGLYTAPATPGTYHVRAALAARPEVGATATAVVVAEAEPPRLTIVPAQASVAAGGAQTFLAEVAGLPEARVSWSVAEAGGGTVDEAGRYSAPLATGTYHVVATSVADGTLRATAVVTVEATDPAVLTVTPATAMVQIGSAVDFDADAAVSWSVAEAGGGAVDETGRYTAPLATGTYHVVATSVAQPGRTATAEVTVTEPGGNLVDYGGPVMPTARVYAIWWGDQAALSDSKVALDAFIRDLQGSSYLAIADQYLRGAKAHVELGGHYEDSSIPDEAYNLYMGPKACEAITNEWKEVDPEGIYFVFTSFPVIAAGGAGWHGYDWCNGATYRLVWVSHSDQFIDQCGGRPGSGAAAVLVFSHELLETMTDGSVGHAWWDLEHREIADKCGYDCHMVGPSRWFSAGLWSNETGACEPETLPWIPIDWTNR